MQYYSRCTLQRVSSSRLRYITAPDGTATISRVRVLLFSSFLFTFIVQPRGERSARRYITPLSRNARVGLIALGRCRARELLSLSLGRSPVRQTSARFFLRSVRQLSQSVSVYRRVVLFPPDFSTILSAVCGPVCLSSKSIGTCRE